MLTKKDFNSIVFELRRVRPREPMKELVWLETVKAVCEGLRETNPRFNKDKFLDAVFM